MVAGSPFIGRDQEAELGLGKPERHGTTQHAFAAHGRTLAGDDEDVAQAAVMSAIEKVEEQIMRLALIEAVKIEPRLDGKPSLGELLLGRAFERMMDTARAFRLRLGCCGRYRLAGRRAGWRRRTLFGCGAGGLFFLEGENILHTAGKRAGGFRHLAPEHAFFRIELASALHDPSPTDRVFGRRI